MKSIISIIAFFAAAGIIFTSCEPEKFEPIGEPFSKVDGIKGSWKITSIIQIDEVAVAKELAFTQLDITQFFDFSNYRITFNVDEANNPSTFEITNPDNAPNFVLTSGKWTFDNVLYPSFVFLIKVDAEMLPIDTTRIELVATPRDYLPLKYKYTRKSAGEKLISYSYSFQRDNL
jgi:hypothetical protein